MLAEAHVRARPELDMPFVLAMYVETRWIRKPPGVVVCSESADRDGGSLGDIHAGKRHIACGGPIIKRYRPVPSQGFLDRRSDQIAICPYLFELIGIAEQTDKQRSCAAISSVTGSV